ncbi:MAG: 5-formyltetrahydrofolate cyclo-ligase [Phycisphaerae bacterium]|nr:5-formyltetrahydrofolate cyclo-ligase [Phycisphaerae bacterium]
MPNKALRQELRQRLAAIPAEQLQKRSAAACRLLCEQKEYLRAEILMLFLSTPYEIDTQQLAQQAWADLKRVLAPRVSWDQRRMLPIEITSLSSGVKEGSLGIREPVEGPPVPVSDIDLVIVPGLGFDRHGYRLGRGRGFYEGFLSQPEFRGVTCATALEEQVLESIPVGPGDIRIKMLVTDVKVRRFTK